MKIKNQDGSIAIISVVSLLILGIIIAGIQPMMTNNLNMSVRNRDIIEAQYAAEAGIKRVIANIQQVNPTWEWLDQDINLLDEDNPIKRYNVFIYTEGDVNRSHIQPTTSGTYVVSSTGTVGAAMKTITVVITRTVGTNLNEFVQGDVFGQYAVFSHEDVYIWGGQNPIINGKMGFSGNNIKIESGSNFLKDLFYITKGNTVQGWHTWLTNSMYDDTRESIGWMTVSLPILSSLPEFPSSQPTDSAIFSYPATLNSPSYWYNSGLTYGGNVATTQSSSIYINGGLHLSKQGSYNYGSITSNSDLVLHVKGDLDLSNGSYIRSTNGNITIYATGGLSLSGGSYIKSDNGSVTIITNGNVNLTDNNNYIQSGGIGNLKVVSRQGSISLNNNCYMNGGNVFLQANKNVELRQTTSINNNDNYSGAITNIYANGSSLSGSFVIGGAASLFVTTTGFNFSENFNAPRTVFVSASGQTNISNSMNIGGIFTNGSLNITNSPTITFNLEVIRRLGLIASSNGAGSIIVGNWRK